MSAPDLGGDVVIGDGEYCGRCPLADASECMSTTPCSRRFIARRLSGAQPPAAIDLAYYDPPA